MPPRFLSDDRCIDRDPIVFFAIEDGERVVCRVSHDALLSVAHGCASPRVTPAIWKATRRLVESVARLKLEAGACERDGAIAITREDLACADRALLEDVDVEQAQRHPVFRPG